MATLKLNNVTTLSESGGAITITPNTTASGNVTITGSLTTSGSLTTINYISGALLTPTSSGTPSFAGSDGQFMFGSGSGGYFLFAYLGGAWRSGSLA